MKGVSLILGLLCIAAGIFFAWFVPRAWLWKGTGNAVSVTVADGWTCAQTGAELERVGIIDSASGYRFYAHLDETASHPKAGVYPLLPHSSYQSVARLLAFGPPRNEVKITVPEGWSIAEINNALVQYNAVIPKTIPDILRTKYPFLTALPSDASLEGYLFPDTYRVYADQLPQSLIAKQLDEFAKREPQLSADARAAGRSLSDVVILASIVEKEVSDPADRKIVAGIFWNRLKLGMALQSDATVNYITNGGRTRPTLDDLETESAYNTYKHPGLPPGPISNPGDTALDAAVHPTATSYLYFLTDDAGRTYFARTFAEHQQNRIKAFGR